MSKGFMDLLHEVVYAFSDICCCFRILVVRGAGSLCEREWLPFHVSFGLPPQKKCHHSFQWVSSCWFDRILDGVLDRSGRANWGKRIASLRVQEAQSGGSGECQFLSEFRNIFCWTLYVMPSLDNHSTEGECHCNSISPQEFVVARN